MKKILSSLLVLLLFGSPAVMAKKKGGADIFKIGKGKFKAAAPARDVTNVVGDAMTISMAGAKRNGSGSITLIYKGDFSQLTQGSTIDLTEIANAGGKVQVFFSTTKTARSGKTTTISSGEGTTITGTLKIVNGNDETFTATFKGKVTNALVQITNPLKDPGGDPVEKTTNTKIGGKFTTIKGS